MKSLVPELGQGEAGQIEGRLNRLHGQRVRKYDAQEVGRVAMRSERATTCPTTRKLEAVRVTRRPCPRSARRSSTSSLGCPRGAVRAC